MSGRARRGSRRGVWILGVLGALVLLVASVLVFAFSSPTREIMILGSKDFKVDDMEQYDLEKKLIYANESALLETDPWLPHAENETFVIHADPGVEEDGDVYAYFTMAREVYPEDLLSEEDYSGWLADYRASDRVKVALGERVEFEGYTIRFIGAHIAKNGPDYAALILEEIPDNVTVFPGGDPEVW